MAWKTMPSEERKKWDDMAARDKARFKVEKQMYTGPWKVPVTSKTKRDPSAPKRPMSAFLFYSNSKRGMIRRKHKNVSNADISKILSKMWKEATPEERKVYIDREFSLRQEYKVKMAEYKSGVKEKEDSVRQKREEDALRQVDEGALDAVDMEPLEHWSSEDVVDAIPLAQPLLDFAQDEESDASSQINQPKSTIFRSEAPQGSVSPSSWGTDASAQWSARRPHLQSHWNQPTWSYEEDFTQAPHSDVRHVHDSTNRLEAPDTPPYSYYRAVQSNPIYMYSSDSKKVPTAYASKSPMPGAVYALHETPDHVFS